MVVTLGELAVRFGCELRGVPLHEVDSVATLTDAHPRAVTFLAESRLRAALAQTRAENCARRMPWSCPLCSITLMFRPDWSAPVPRKIKWRR